MKKDEHGHLHGADGKFTSEGKGDGASSTKEEKKAPAKAGKKAPTKEERLEAAKRVFEPNTAPVKKEEDAVGSAKGKSLKLAQDAVDNVASIDTMSVDDLIDNFVSLVNPDEAYFDAPAGEFTDSPFSVAIDKYMSTLRKKNGEALNDAIGIVLNHEGKYGAMSRSDARFVFRREFGLPLKDVL